MLARRFGLLLSAVLLLSASVGCLSVSERPDYGQTQFHVLVASETTVAGSVGRGLTEGEVQREVDRLLSLKAPSAAPEKLVLYEVPGSRRTKIKSAKKWLELREATSRNMKSALEQTGVFKNVEFLPGILLPSGVPGDLKTLRIASARAQADAVLIYSTEAGYEERPNAWSVLYLTLIGAGLFPGTDVSSMAVSKAVLLDVRTGYIYLLTESYASRSGAMPVAAVQEKLEEMEFEVRTESLIDLAKTVAAKVRTLRDPDSG
jgi:hypothetical protein